MRYGRGWTLLLVLAILTPLGIVAAGGAWGEWDLAGVGERAGLVPEGMRDAVRESPESPLPDYTVPGLEGSFLRQGAGTIITALLGAGVTALAAYAIARITGHGGVS